eukprot:3867326-Pleurochrysis_carterae.AAC.1
MKKQGLRETTAQRVRSSFRRTEVLGDHHVSERESRRKEERPSPKLEENELCASLSLRGKHPNWKREG